MKVVNIGFSSVLNAERIVAVISSDSAPSKRRISEAREAGMLVDATYGRKTRSIIVMDSGHIVTSTIAPDTLAGRIESEENG